MKYSISLPKEFVTAFLASVYIIGFVLSPYWVLQGSTGAILFYSILTLALGFVWLRLTSGTLQLELKTGDLWMFVALAVSIIVLNFRAVTSVIPFRGDEQLHIERTLELVRRIPLTGAVLIAGLFILFLVAGFKKQTWFPLVGAVIVAGAMIFFLGQNAFDDVESTPVFFLRYPFINYWFFALIPRLASLINAQYHEFLYRLVPIISMIAVAWAFQRKTEAYHPLVAIGWGLAVATIPSIFYYSSILYIEPPAVFLMTLVCLDIKNLLHQDHQQLLNRPSWYALILIGFVKETTIPFLVCFLAVRMIVRLQMWTRERSADPSGLRWLADEVRVAFAVIAPVALYVYFRTFTGTRSFVPNVSTLFDPTIYPVIARAFGEQFGIFFLFFLGGCFVLWKERENSSAVFFAAATLAVLIFHILDKKELVGYSRFHLFIVPAILAGSLKFIRWVDSHSRVTSIVLIAATLVSNLLLSPVHTDGVKTAYWGNYFSDVSEHYYPYQDALLWLKDNVPNKRVLFTGLDFYYPFQFYWSKLDWKPRRAGIPTRTTGDERLAITSILEEAARENYEVVVYRVLEEGLVLPNETGEFRVQAIRNSTHTLLVFYKP